MAEDNQAMKSLTQPQQELVKALATGYDTNPATQTNGAAIRPEFLDEQIETLTFTENDLQFFRDLTRVRAEGPVQQYIVQTSKGRTGASRFVAEPNIGSRNAQAISKRSVRMKFISDTREITIATQTTNNVTDPTMLETDAAITVVAKTIEWASFYGDASLNADVNDPQNAGLEFDGLARLIDAGNVLDARGAELSDDILNVAATYVSKGYGTPTDAYMPIGVHSAFVQKYQGNQRAIMGTNPGEMTLGYGINAFQSARGNIKLHGSTIMENDLILDEEFIPGPEAPLAPAVEASVNTGAGGQFREEDIATHSYKVVTHSEEAESRPSEVVTGAVSNATDGVELSIQVNGMYQAAPQHVVIYRQDAETGLFYQIKRIGVNKAENGVITFVDTNEVIPGTADVFLGEMTQSVVHLYEFLPMMKLPLAQVRATNAFAILFYGALALRAPKKWVHIKNVAMTKVANPYNPGFHQF